MFGIEPVTEAYSSHESIAEVTDLLEAERAVNRELQAKIQHLEAKIYELERTSTASLVQQADELSHKCHTVCGPDTYEHVSEFSLDTVIGELKEQVPDIYDFFMKLANVQRNIDSSGKSSTQEVKAISVLYTVFNARSRRVKGMQLLMSMMLIA